MTAASRDGESDGDTGARADLLDIAVQMNSAGSVDEILQVVMARVGEVIPFDRAGVGLCDEARESLTMREIVLDPAEGEAGPGARPEESGTTLPVETSNVLGWVVLNREPHLRRSLDEPWPFDSIQESREAVSHIVAPLEGRSDEVLGVLNVGAFRENAFDSQDVELFSQYAHLTGVAIENLRNVQRARELSVRDGLTGAYNFRHFKEVLQREIARVDRYDRDLSLLMMDVDRFKEFNDRWGHQAGDQVLVQLVEILQANVREADQVFRYGGEEFAVLLPDTGRGDARAAARKLMERIREGNVYRPTRSRTVPVRVSMGLATAPRDAQTGKGLVACADQALYHSKSAGRDCLTGFGDVEGMDSVEGYFEEGEITPRTSATETAGAARRPDPEHSRRVMALAEELAESLGLPGDQQANLQIAAMYHDLGEVGIPAEVMEKDGSLDGRERRLVETHPVVGEELLQKSVEVEEVLRAVLHHHERYDGTGYPEGLSGEEIPFLARILAVAETFDALVTERPYREPVTVDEAYEVLREAAGYQLDPEVVETFVEHDLGRKLSGAVPTGRRARRDDGEA